jgi:ketosteroid isomerase-like protein
LPGPPERIPWAGSFHGKQQIAGFFAALAEAAEFSEFAPHDMFEHGDAVVVTGTSTARIKRTGKTVNNRWVQVARYRNGKLVFLEDYNDTAAYLLALS